MKKLSVASCSACPFFGRSLLTLLAGNDGGCSMDRLGSLPRPIERGMSSSAPVWCPLRSGALTIELKELN